LNSVKKQAFSTMMERLKEMARTCIERHLSSLDPGDRQAFVIAN